jgi:cytoskeletal protein CcmA (bactofilin family)
MGFFGDLKQDLSQAVNELLPEEKAAAERENTTEESTTLSDLGEGEAAAENAESLGDLPDVSAMLDAMDEKSGMSEADYENLLNEALNGDITLDETPAEGETSENTDMSDAESALDSVFADMEAEGIAAVETEAEPEPVFEETSIEDNNFKGADFKMDSNANYSDETSVITLGMTVNGDITTEGSLEILGNVKGNIDVSGKLNVTGHITGNSKAHEIYAENAKITGDVSSDSSVKIGAGTVIVGNITGFSAAVAGAVKGDIDIHGPVILDSSAIVMGNIRSKSVQINNGAAIEGMCSQCYADVSPTSFFDDYKPEQIGGKKKTEKTDK